MSEKRIKRQVWVVVYERRGERMPTLREYYWSQESADERATALLPECATLLVGLMDEWDTSLPLTGVQR